MPLLSISASIYIPFKGALSISPYVPLSISPLKEPYLHPLYAAKMGRLCTSLGREHPAPLGSALALLGPTSAGLLSPGRLWGPLTWRSGPVIQIYIYIVIHIYIYICLSLSLSIYLSLFIDLFICLLIDSYLSLYIYVYTYIHI